MHLQDHFRLLARYNVLANVKLYDACVTLGDELPNCPAAVSFGSIHGPLNPFSLLIPSGWCVWAGKTGLS